MANIKLVVIAIVFFLFGISGADALNTTLNTTPISSGFTPDFINIDANTMMLVNLTTNATEGNVTSVTFSFGAGASYVASSNRSSLLDWAFSTTGTSIAWTYGAGATVFPANATYNFYFNITAGTAGELSLIPQITVTKYNETNASVSHTLTTAINVTADGRATAGILTVNFALAGFVKNETGSLSNNTNVSVYAVVMQPNAPPAEWFLRSTRTDANGFFSLTGINATSFTSTVYRVKIIHYNETLSNNGVATKVGPTLPPFPGMLFSRPPKMAGREDFDAPPTINGTTFNLQPAVTLNISATDWNGIYNKFGYEVSDINSGFPIDSSIFASTANVQVVVPAGRDYNVMVARPPSDGTVGFLSGPPTVCNGTFINATTCPSMPRSNASTGSLTAVSGSSINVRFNLTDIQRQFYGCLSVSGNATQIDNITVINPRMMPYAGFVPPVEADDGNISTSDQAQLNMTFHKLNTSCPASAIAWFNISLLSSTYLVEFFGSNTTVSNAAFSAVGVVQNVSLASGSVNLNLTLKPMLGTWYTGGLGAVNTSKMLFNFTNASGTTLTQAPNVELVVYYPQTGKIRYMIDTTEISSGIFYFPIVNETNVFARINVYGRGPPVEKKVNLTATKVVVTVDDGAGFGFRRMLANGTLDTDMNVSAIPIQMRFLTNSAACNVVDPATSCELATMTAASFNPFKVMMAGKVNMELKIISSGVKITYINYDMFQAKPPTNTMFDEASEAASSGNAVLWKFGSFAPADAYDYAIIAMPYSDSTFDEGKEIRASIPVLYDEDMNEVWNRTAGNTQDNLTYDYAGAKSANYNSTGYRGLLDATGVSCSTTDSNIASFYCYIDISGNILYMRIPHFSSVGPQVSGTAVGSTAAAAAAGGSGGGGIGDQRSTVVIAQINPGAPATLSIDGKRIGVSEIALEVLSQAKDVSVSVTKFMAKPASVTQAAAGTLYSYFDFSTNVPNTNIKLATIKFQVSQKWIADNGIDKTKVSLQHWETNKWDNLGAKLLKEDADFAYYESATNGFSVFAVTGEKIGAVGAAQQQVQQEAQQQQAAQQKAAKPASQQAQTTAILVVIVVIVIAAIAYTMLPKRRAGRRW